MRGSDVSEIFSLTRTGYECCSSLLRYTLLTPIQLNYIAAINEVNTQMEYEPLTPASMSQYTTTMQGILKEVTSALRQLQVENEFELMVVGGVEGIRMAIAYFDEAIRTLDEIMK